MHKFYVKLKEPNENGRRFIDGLPAQEPADGLTEVIMPTDIDKEYFLRDYDTDYWFLEDGTLNQTHNQPDLQTSFLIAQIKIDEKLINLQDNKMTQLKTDLATANTDIQGLTNSLNETKQALEQANEALLAVADAALGADTTSTDEGGAE